jgi:hypothetical protein
LIETGTKNHVLPSGQIARNMPVVFLTDAGREAIGLPVIRENEPELPLDLSPETAEEPEFLAELDAVLPPVSAETAEKAEYAPLFRPTDEAAPPAEAAEITNKPVKIVTKNNRKLKDAIHAALFQGRPVGGLVRRRDDGVRGGAGERVSPALCAQRPQRTVSRKTPGKTASRRKTPHSYHVHRHPRQAGLSRAAGLQAAQAAGGAA